MQYIAQIVNGIEDIGIQEIKELINVKAEKILPGRLLFEIDKVKDLNYNTRSLERIYELLKKFNFKNLEDIKKQVKEIDFKFKGTFKVKCARKGNHKFNSQEVAMSIGKVIFDKGFKVDVKNPEFNVLVDIIDNICIVGIDVSNASLCKRDYRIKTNKQSINACVAYAMLRLANWDKKEVLLDPFCKDGVIVIEAALFGLKIPRGHLSEDFSKIKREDLQIFAFDALMPNVRSTEINAKLADINKQIKFSKCDLDWLDTKFDKESVDKIITVIFTSEEKDALKEFKELFYQADYVLNKKGKLLVATQKKDLLLKQAEKFKLEKEVKVTIGGLDYSVLVLNRI
ncbi:MAG: hypothetical protein KJ939_01195 [Nanoarchaeota archaeon]|nr:hypothetical protein [Nanoarchaeota archaeon]